MSYDSYEVPDGITPLVGYRGWLVRDDKLFSCFRQDVEWPVAEPLKSQCIRPTYRDDDGVMSPSPEHYSSPFLDCTCGIYALHEYPTGWVDHEGKRRPKPKPWPYEGVSGIVHGWGHIVAGDKGFRAEYARPIALIGRPRSQRWAPVIERLAERYGLEVVDARDLRRTT